MGYASYYENIVERASELAHFAQPVEVKDTTERVTARPRAAIRLIISPRPKPSRIPSIAEQALSSRELHILCLSELRPKAVAQHHQL
jgi:hypothetical protein